MTKTCEKKKNSERMTISEHILQDRFIIFQKFSIQLFLCIKCQMIKKKLITKLSKDITDTRVTMSQKICQLDGL